MNQQFNQIPSVNFHLWEPCNMRCKFCFATFQDVKQSVLPKGHLPKEQALEVVRQLSGFGFEKITFAGGEPTLCPWLPELIAIAKESGMTTMLVTNGSRLNDDFLKANKGQLDWISISIDSLNSTTNLLTGRAVVGLKPLQLSYYKELSDKVKFFGYGLKINTVVSRANFTEDMSQFMLYANPIRWKVFQVLPMIGQNDSKINDFTISELEFQAFLNRHSDFKNILVPETNEQIKGSYVMIDPAGRFFDNSKGTHNYSQPILDIGIRGAFSEINYDSEKFIERGGQYDWVRL